MFLTPVAYQLNKVTIRKKGIDMLLVEEKKSLFRCKLFVTWKKTIIFIDSFAKTGQKRRGLRLVFGE